VPLIATEGYAAPCVGGAYLRARELCRQLGETPDVSEALWGLWTFYTLRADLETAREIAEEILSLAGRFDYPGLAMRGHWAMEITFAHLGKFFLAMEHFDKALSLYDPHRHLDDGFLYALNPGVAMPCFASWALWFLGQPDLALERSQHAVTLARELSEPLGLAHALLFAAILHQLRREERKAQERAEAAIALSSEHGLAMYRAMATVARGWAMIERKPEEAIEQMRYGIATLQETGTELLHPHFLALLAEGLGKARRPDEGLRLLEDALAASHRTGERCYEAELYRLKGELLLMRMARRGLSQSATGGLAVIASEPPAVGQVEACFSQSIRIAREQKSSSLELRAATSAARLYQSQGKRKEAQCLLKQIYDRFTEGFDTADLREAKAMLDQLQ
jgi:predicted ATPase